MKNYYLLCAPGAGLLGGAPAARVQVTLAGPVTFYIGAGRLVTVPSCLTVGAGATLTNEGQLDSGGNLTNNGTVTAPAALLRATGAAPQTLAGAAALPVQNLNVNNPAAWAPPPAPTGPRPWKKTAPI